MTPNSLLERHLEGIADYLDPQVIGDSEAMHDAPGKLREAAAELRRVSAECEALRTGLDSICRRYSNGASAETLRLIAMTTLQQTKESN